MIRKASLEDLDQIEETYEEHFRYEETHEKFTVFQKGVYPTRKDAQKAVRAGALYVYETSNGIAGSIILNQLQPEEYERVAWGTSYKEQEIMVVHLLLVRPGMAGKGIASSLIRYAEGLAQKRSCKAVRLDTGGQNLPALSLYKKMGFRVAAASAMKVGGEIEHAEHLFLEKTV